MKYRFVKDKKDWLVVKDPDGENTILAKESTKKAAIDQLNKYLKGVE